MESGRAALERLVTEGTDVSAHYFVDEEGRILRLVAESERAWHAGIAAWRGHTDINNRSIGIEIVNPGHEFGYRPFPAAQMDAVEALCRDILARHPQIPPRNVVGHSDVAPWRKEDPGELFDWPRLARAGIGVFPSAAQIERSPAHGDPMALLQRIGYRVDASHCPVETALLAFQRRFRPSGLTGTADADTLKRLNAVTDLIEAETATAV